MPLNGLRLDFLARAASGALGAAEVRRVQDIVAAGGAMGAGAA